MKSFIIRLFFIVVLLFLSTVLPTYAQEYGSIKVIPPSEDCEIIIDGIQVGIGTTTTKITEGTHNVVVNLKDGTPIYNKTVQIIAQEVKTVPISYELKHPGLITQEVTPKPVSPFTNSPSISPTISTTNRKKGYVYLDVVNHAENKEYQGGSGYDGGIVFPIGRYDSIDVGLTNFSGNNKVQTLSKGTLGFTGIFIGDLGQVTSESSTLYFEIGGCSYTFTHDIDKALKDALLSLGYRYEESVDSTIGLYVKFGILFDLSESMQMDCGVKYASLNPTATGKITKISTGASASDSMPMDLSHMSFYVGLAF